jgi:glycosyl transferase, family 25
MKIHVINLKESVERRRSITTQLNRLNLAFELFDAIKGVDIPDYELEQKVDMAEVKKYPYWLTKGMLGASLSHMEVYRQIIESDEPWHLILEDDVILSSNLEFVLKQIEINSSFFESHLILLYVTNIHDNIKLSRTNCKSTAGVNFFQVVNKGVAGAGAYVIHKSIASSFLEKNPKISVGSDSWSDFLSMGIYEKIFCVYPFAVRPGFFESTIGYTNMLSPIYKIKHTVEKYRIPIFYQFLKRRRKIIWEKVSKIEFVI